MLAFHVGDESQLKTQGYGGHAMKVHVHRRRPQHLTARLHRAEFTVEAQMLLNDTPESTLGGLLFARR